MLSTPSGGVGAEVNGREVALVSAETNPLTGGFSLQVGGQLLGIGSAYTWQTKPAPSALTGQIYISDIGIGGSYWYSDGSKWRPVGGRVTLRNALTVISNSGAAKVVMDYATLPAGLFADGDLIHIHVVKDRTGGTADTETTDICIGTASTTVGTSVGLGTGVLATTQVQFTSNWSVKKQTPTTVMPTAMTGSTGVGGGTAVNVIATVPNMDEQTTYLQVTSDLTIAGGEVANLRAFVVTLVCGS